MLPEDHRSKPWVRRLYVPAYSATEAARYASTHPSNISYWYYSASSPGPVLGGKEKGKQLSYLQLIEVAFVATFLRQGITLRRIRKAHQYLSKSFSQGYPFAHFRLKTEGRHILLDLPEDELDRDPDRIIVTDEAGQLAWPRLLAERFEEFEYEDFLAVKWHVRGQKSPVTIDPRVAFGAPSVRGIPTWVVRDSYKAGESPRDICENYRLSEEELGFALRFENIELS